MNIKRKDAGKNVCRLSPVQSSRVRGVGLVTFSGRDVGGFKLYWIGFVITTILVNQERNEVAI